MAFCKNILHIFVLLGSLSATHVSADEIGDYEAEADIAISFPMQSGDLVVFTCVKDEGSENRHLSIWVPITNAELSAFLQGQRKEDAGYEGYYAFPTGRFDIYLSVGKKKDISHPIDDQYIFSTDTIEYSNTTEGDLIGEWYAKFSLYQSSDKPEINNLFMFISNNDVYLKLNSWNSTKKYVPFPKEGKKAAFSMLNPTCAK